MRLRLALVGLGAAGLTLVGGFASHARAAAPVTVRQGQTVCFTENTVYNVCAPKSVGANVSYGGASLVDVSVLERKTACVVISEQVPQCVK